MCLLSGHWMRPDFIMRSEAQKKNRRRHRKRCIEENKKLAIFKSEIMKIISARVGEAINAAFIKEEFEGDPHQCRTYLIQQYGPPSQGP